LKTVDPDTVKVCDYSHKSGDSGRTLFLEVGAVLMSTTTQFKRNRAGKRTENERTAA
jgi:hypothetical protein